MGRDENGKIRRRYETVRGTKRQAQQRLRQLLTAVDHGSTPSTERIKLCDWLQRWTMERIVPHRKRSTVDRYERAIRRHIEPTLGRLELDKISPAEINSFEAQLTAEGESATSVNLVHAVLSGAMRYAASLELIMRNPASLVSPPTKPKKEAQAPSMESVRRMLRLAEELNHYLFPCIHLLAYTGMRRGEAVALTWNNVDLEAGHLNVVASVGRVGRQGLVVDVPKSKSGQRKIDLDARTVEILRDHRRRQIEFRAALGDESWGGDKVFTNHKGDWVNPNMVTRVIGDFARRSGADGITARSLRRFRASVALQTGKNIVVVSKRLGHSNVSITADIYAHALPGWQKETANAFAAAMAAGEPSGN